MNLAELQKEAHAIAKEHGWWDTERSFGDCIADLHRELSRVLETYREQGLGSWYTASVPEGGHYTIDQLQARREGAVTTELSVARSRCFLRFIRWPRAHVRYWCWLADWHLRHKRVTRKDGRRAWDLRVGWKADRHSWPRYPYGLNFLSKPLLWGIGSLSHRSDFTDPVEGVLHGGKGWSKKAFDDFVEDISLVAFGVGEGDGICPECGQSTEE